VVRAGIRTSREYAAWSLAHGIQRRFLRRNAARGDVVAQLAIDPAVIADPYAAFDELRARGRVVRNGFVAGTVDHAVADAVLRSEDFGTGAGQAELPAPLRRLHGWVTDQETLGPVDPPSMLVVDPPDHTRYRRLVSRSFTARKVGRMADRVADVAGRLLDEIAADAPAFDLVERYASRLPIGVIADLLGIPDEERVLVLEWGNQAAVTLDPGLDWPTYRTAATALREMHAWFDTHLERLRREPGDDLLSGLLRARGADQLTDVEVHAIGLLVLGAGFETTVNLIGNAVALLDQHPDQLARLVAEPDGWPNAVEEVLRVESPVQLTMRAALRDTDVAGESVAAGEAMLVYLAGANRDPAVFADPGRFDVTRPNAGDNLSFSAGIHYCLGASLARLEAAVGLRLLYERFPDLRVAGAPQRRGTRVLRGYAALPVTTRAEVAAR
jgi:cytochrome P450